MYYKNKLAEGSSGKVNKTFKSSSFFSIAKIPDTLDIYGYIDYISVKYQGISTDYLYSGQNIFR